MDGTEIPILDGSSEPFVEAIEKGGIQEQSEHRDVFELRTTLNFLDKENGVEILAMPSDHYRVTTMVDYKSDVLGQQQRITQQSSRVQKRDRIGTYVLLPA
jgi:UDP-3-O-[3-hydroxymyristoyl] N-acetylglucosamine deacetylase/3-hydroxyacyl-[acyl-carrier-protein] dehydratase